jgi:peptidoglycan/LPS O-acetylase OafA/YrhL
VVERTRSHEHFGCLDALRGLAALWVVLNHVEEHLDLVKPDVPAVVWTWVFEYGGLGVLVFFAISGYVIAHSLRNVRIDTGSAGNFMARRLVRLTPPYYAAVVLALVVSAGSAVVNN